MTDTRTLRRYIPFADTTELRGRSSQIIFGIDCYSLPSVGDKISVFRKVLAPHAASLFQIKV